MSIERRGSYAATESVLVDQIDHAAFILNCPPMPVMIRMEQGDPYIQMTFLHLFLVGHTRRSRSTGRIRAEALGFLRFLKRLVSILPHSMHDDT